MDKNLHKFHQQNQEQKAEIFQLVHKCEDMFRQRTGAH